MTHPAPPAALRRALRANAAFSLLSAVLAIALSDPLADEFAVRPLVLVLVGAALAGYAAALAARPRIAPALAWSIVAADLGWVAGTAIVLGGFAGSISGLGVALLVAAAGVVGALAVAQARAAWEPA